MSSFKSNLGTFFGTIHKGNIVWLKMVKHGFKFQFMILRKCKESYVLTTSAELIELQLLKGFRYESKINFIW